MVREHSIELAGQRLLEAHGYCAEKRGLRGWPDREVFVAPSHHEWIEWKRPGGDLTPAQKRRIPKLRAAGEFVHVIDNVGALAELIDFWKDTYGAPPAIRAS